MVSLLSFYTIHMRALYVVEPDLLPLYHSKFKSKTVMLIIKITLLEMVTIHTSNYFESKMANVLTILLYFLEKDI